MGCRHVQEAFSRPDPVPTGGAPARATAVAALAADATNDHEIEYDPEDIMGGQGLVEAVFSGMFEDEFDGVMPVRNHKVSVCRGWEAMSSKCAHAQLSRTWETARGTHVSWTQINSQMLMRSVTAVGPFAPSNSASVIGIPSLRCLVCLQHCFRRNHAWC